VTPTQLTRCDRLLVGQGTDVWDPLCVLDAGHTGVCKPACEQCEGDGSYSDLAPCTTHDRDCACNGPRVVIDPCEVCGGSGHA
jgi:hypothetical protein